MVRSRCVEKLKCPDCKRFSLQAYYNEDKDLGVSWYSSFCHGRCYELKGDPYAGKAAPKVKIKTRAQLREEVNLVRSCKIFKPTKPYRGIPPKFFRSWGVRLLYSEYDGRTPYGLAFPYSDFSVLCGWKARTFKRKGFFSYGRTSNVDPFGLERALKLGGDTLYITEGEFDAIALDYCLYKVTGILKHPVVSLTAGGGSIEKNLNLIETRVKRKYSYIVLVLDDDVVGHKAENKAIDMWRDKIYLVNKPKNCKDANDAVLCSKEIQMGKLALNFK